MIDLESFLRATTARHNHLCPRQVLGVRMGICAGKLLGLGLPQQDKRLLTIVETDGCVIDGIEVATGCSVGHRTLRVEDFGKVAATFVDTRLELAIRILPHSEARGRAAEFAPGEPDRWRAQLVGYQRMPDDLLLTWTAVELISPLQSIIGCPDARAVCAVCHEEILNNRQVSIQGTLLCRSCAGARYYLPVPDQEQPANDPASSSAAAAHR